MSDKVIGKIIGSLLGFSLGGPVGSLLGFIVGHVHDNRHSNPIGMDNPWARMAASAQDFRGTNQQTAFTLGVIVLGAKMAKADGKVTREEVAAFKRVFNVAPHQEDSVGALFDQARQTAQGFEPYALHLAGLFRNNHVVLEEVLGGLFIIAASDNPHLSPAEIHYLKSVAHIFGIRREDFAHIAARAGVTLPENEKPRRERDESYAILGITDTTPPDAIKAAYRALIREHHPDKLLAQGMPAEMVATATEKMKRINNAYDIVCKHKGIQ